MNILVTGAASFFASHIIEEFLEDNHYTIIGCDNFCSGTKENIKLLKSFDKNDKFTFIEANIRDFYSLNKIIKEKNITQVYHFVTILSMQESIYNPLFSNDIKRILFSTSAALYSDEPIQPKDENSITKLISSYEQRLSTTSDYTGVISISENKFKNNKIDNIYEDGEQYRDFVYVKDVVKVNIKAMNRPNISGKVFCLGTVIKTSITDLLKFLNEKYSTNIKANYLIVEVGVLKN